MSDTLASRPEVVNTGAMVDLSDTERMIVDTVHDFVERDVRPYVRDIEHANEYPEAMIDQMKELGIFGLAIPESMGGFRVSMPCYVHVTEELARGWMSLAGAMGGHTVVSKLLVEFGTDGAAGDVPAADGDGRGPGDDGAHRAGRWFRPAGDAHGRRAATATTTSSTARRRGSPTPAGRS